MLGSVADAEDVVQDTWLRWSAADRGDVADPRAYLVRITTRLALDRLRLGAGPAGDLRRAVAARAAADRGRRWPAPPADPEEAAELGEQVSLALLVVLETLSPAERAVFVLREVFGMSVGGGRRGAGPLGGRRPADGAPRPGARAGPAAAVRRRPPGAAAR